MRTLVCLLVVGLPSALSLGCGGASPVPREAAPGSSEKRAPASTKGPAGMGDGSVRGGTDPKPGDFGPGGGVPGGPPGARPPAAMADAVAGREKAGGWSRKAEDKGPQSGLLTAGSFDDNLNPQYFRTFVKTFAQNSAAGDFPAQLLGRRVLLLVKGGDGNPVGNARVRVAAPGGGRAVELTTRSDGRAVFLSSWDDVRADSPLSVTVTPPGGGAGVSQTVPKGAERWEVTLPGVKGKLPTQLDLLIVLDTTGSMGDELEFLKSEVKGIATAVRAKFPKVDQRYGLILYRDDGDEYVTRKFDFTPSLDRFRKDLGDQKAGGGGDEPEAMHRGLEDALQMRWRDENTARVLFLVTDAPPHTQFLGRTAAAVNALRKQGVAIYPVACSGYKDDAELVLRACAVLTGSQFLFLTDDSGVGNAHGEPHIPFYHVQRLDRLMIRMIAGELSGKRIAPDPKEVIRTVGKPIN